MSEVMHPHAHPLSQRCSARSKRSGQRCKRTAIASMVCAVHGGRAKRVRDKAQRTIALWEAQQNEPPSAIERRTPEEILLDLLHDGDITLAKVKTELAEGGVSGALMQVWGEWMDRMSKLSRLVIDSGIQARVDDRRATISRQQADHLMAVINAIFADSRVIIEPGVPVGSIVLDAMATVDAQQTVVAA